MNVASPEVENRMVDALLAASTISLPSDVPPGMEERFAEADAIIEQVAGIYGEAARGDYFASSTLRYRQYLAWAAGLPKGGSILEVGSAPGHVSIGMHLLGLKVTGINLNANYRSLYPSPDWMETLRVSEHNIEEAPLPFADAAFDAAMCTEVLEHFAVKHPHGIIEDIRRKLKPGGLLYLSTPNVCNLSNIAALLRGINIFWDPGMFYGSLDRHNREFTPQEVRQALEAAGFGVVHFYGFNCHSNWRGGGAEVAFRAIARLGATHPLLLNTTAAVARNPG